VLYLKKYRKVSRNLLNMVSVLLVKICDLTVCDKPVDWCRISNLTLISVEDDQWRQFREGNPLGTHMFFFS